MEGETDWTRIQARGVDHSRRVNGYQGRSNSIHVIHSSNKGDGGEVEWQPAMLMWSEERETQQKD